jgi:hypothetical protein
VSSLNVISLDMLFQIACLDVAGFTTLRGAYVRTVVVVNHRVTNQIYRHLERLTASRDLALEGPLAGVGSLVGLEDVHSPEGGTAPRDIALERPLTCVGSFVLSGIGRRHFLAALPEPA